MFYTRKLKPDRSISGFIYPLLLLLLFGLTSLVFGFSAGFITLAGFLLLYALYCLYIYSRTGNLGHLVVCAYNVFMAALLWVATRHLVGRWEPREEWAIAYITGLIFFGVVIVYLAATKKIKWRGRELFELAAAPVEETGNGYTSRPRPVGRVEFSREELLAFARFCARHLVAAVYVSPRQVTFVPVRMGDEYTFMFRSAGSRQDTTWISFDLDGEVAVHVAHKDYLEYLEPLAFDPLCESLGRLFIEFAELHRRGEGVRIIDRLDALRMSYFS